jgi:hypothetical protein
MAFPWVMNPLAFFQSERWRFPWALNTLAFFQSE